MLPLIGLAVYLAVDHVHTLEKQRDREAAALVKNVAAEIDQHLAARIAALNMLAVSPFVDDASRWGDLYQAAQGFRQSFGSHVILASPDMQMQFNTRVPLGSALPRLPRPQGHAAAPAVLASGKPAASDLFIGPVSQGPLLSLAVPALRQGTVTHVLMTTFEPRLFQAPLDQVALPAGWSLTLLDSLGQVIARRGPERLVSPAGPTQASGHFAAPLSAAPWSVTLDIPADLLHAPLVNSASALIAAILLATLIGVFGGRRASHRLSRAVAALVSGPAPHDTQAPIAEIAAARQRLDEAAAARTQAEQARQSSDEALKASQQLARIGNWVWDVHTGVHTWSQEVYRIYGRDPALPAAVYPEVQMYFTAESWTRLSAAVEQGLSQGNAYQCEAEVVRPDGTHRWIIARGQAWRDASGTLTRLLGTVQDITEHKQAEAELRQSEQRFRRLFQEAPLAMGILGTDGAMKDLNARLVQLFGYTLADVPNLEAWWPQAFPDPAYRAWAMDTWSAAVSAVEPGTNIDAGEFSITCKEGHVRTVVVFGIALGDDILTSFFDITERRQAEQALQDSEARYARVLDGANEGFWEWDLQRKTLTVSPRFEAMLGYAPGEWRVRPEQWPEQIHPDDFPNARFAIVQNVRGLSTFQENEVRCRTQSGEWRWMLVRGKVVSRDAEGRALLMAGTQTDITHRKQTEELVWQQANYDPLTQLPNRRMLRDRLAQKIKSHHHNDTRLALLFIDLDHFKEINDTLGHDKGDLLLVEAARRISQCVRESDTVSRQGGDEFSIIIPQLSSLDRLEQVAQSLLSTLSRPFDLNGEAAFITASIGITLYPDDATDVEGLLKSADQALYAAKDAGRNRFSFFTQTMQETARNRLRLTNDLRNALPAGQFYLAYQPIVELATGCIHKAEALIRWQHPQRGLISPAEFIPLAESSGLIIELGEWVFRQAASQVRQWRDTHHRDFQISVNKSPVQFADGGLRHKAWFEHLRELGLPGQSFVVEITEGLLLAPRADIVAQLAELRQAGVGISLDDFGTGYSSLSYLQKFDIDYLKIDQSFVRHLETDSKNLSLCKAIIAMAHALGMKVIAEGVETAAQRELLAAAGCDYGQGYLFARPMPAQAFDDWMAQPPAAR
jgi:diguanylate cyclase (GGDEF)-like protein/PAS domain S-box-containing protein